MPGNKANAVRVAPFLAVKARPQAEARIVRTSTPSAGRAHPGQGDVQFFLRFLIFRRFGAFGRDHFGSRVAHEFFVGQLLVDAGDLLGHLGQFLLQPRRLRIEIDQAAEWQARGRFADDDLRRLYTRKRLLRIFPAYWPIAIGVLSVYWLTPELSRDPGKDISILKSLFLLPVDGEPALVVAWTLVYELLFYAIFLSFFISSRVFLATLAVWVTAILVNQAFGAPAAGTRVPLIMCLLDPIVIEFVIGLGIAWAARNLRLPGGWIALAGLVLLLSIVLATPNPVAYRLGFAPALGLIILGSVAVERSMPLTMPRSLVHLGDASYALYLIHVPVIAVSARIIAMTGLPVPWWIFLIANVILAIVAALAYHTGVESAVTRYARKMLDRSVLSKA